MTFVEITVGVFILLIALVVAIALIKPSVFIQVKPVCNTLCLILACLGLGAVATNMYEYNISEEIGREAYHLGISAIICAMILRGFVFWLEESARERIKNKAEKEQ